MPKTLQEILDHGDQLAQRFEDYEPNPADLRPVEPLQRGRRAVQARADAERAVAQAVQDMRAAGYSWPLVGTVLGTSGEAARQRYRLPAEPVDSPPAARKVPAQGKPPRATRSARTGARAAAAKPAAASRALKKVSENNPARPLSSDAPIPFAAQEFNALVDAAKLPPDVRKAVDTVVGAASLPPDVLVALREQRGDLAVLSAAWAQAVQVVQDQLQTVADAQKAAGARGLSHKV